MQIYDKKIQLTIKLASGGETITLNDHRTSVRVNNSGGISLSTAQVSIWGMNPDLMARLSTLGMVFNLIPKNTISVAAGDAQQGLSTAFVGTIMQAYGDFGGAPDVPFRMECKSGGAEDVIPFSATSYTQGVDVVTILSSIAKRAGWGFENNLEGSTTITLPTPYIYGTPTEQFRWVKEAARTINVQLVPGTAQDVIGVQPGPGLVLAVWPLNGNRKSVGIPLITATGNGALPGQMIGYPSYTQFGMIVKTIYDPRLAMGGQFKLETSLKNVSKSGIWNIQKLDLALDALLPRGDWSSTVYAYDSNYPSPRPPQAE